MLIQSCRDKGWSDNSPMTRSEFGRAKLLSFNQHDGVLGDQLAWAIAFNKDALINKEIQLNAVFDGPSDGAKAILRLQTPHLIRLGLHDYAGSFSINLYRRVGGEKSGNPLSTWDEVFPIRVSFHGMTILLTSRQEPQAQAQQTLAQQTLAQQALARQALAQQALARQAQAQQALAHQHQQQQQQQMHSQRFYSQQRAEIDVDFEEEENYWEMHDRRHRLREQHLSYYRHGFLLAPRIPITVLGLSLTDHQQQEQSTLNHFSAFGWSLKAPSLDQYQWEYNAPDPHPERQSDLLQAQLRNAALLYERFRQSGTTIPVFPFLPPFFLQPAPAPPFFLQPAPAPHPPPFHAPPSPPQTSHAETMSVDDNGVFSV